LSSISVTSTCSEDDEADEADIAIEPSQQHRYQTRIRRVFRRVWKGVRKALRCVNSFMTVPLWASILSLIVACVTPLQSALERMEPVKGALGAAGNCSIPLTLVVLGAYFYSEPQEEDMQNGDLSYSQISERRGLEHQTSRSSLLSAFQEMFALKRAPQHQSQTCGEGRTVFVAIFARMVVVPAVMLPVMAILAKFDFHDVFEE
jgi:auxin efflux carrier family protein